MLTRLLALGTTAAVLLSTALALPGRATAQISSCPVADSESIAVCVDRGPEGVYVVGDQITICVTVNVPQILIFPPPPPPQVRITSQVDEDTPTTIFEDGVRSSHCFEAMIVAPTGRERLVAFVLDDNGGVIATSSVSFLSVNQ